MSTAQKKYCSNDIKHILNDPIIKSISIHRIKLTIKEIKPLGDMTSSKEAFFIRTNLGKFKLRACSSVERAVMIEKEILKHWTVFPKFYGRFHRYILMEWVQEGKKIEELSVENCRRLGELIGEQHALNEFQKNTTFEKEFIGRLDKLKNNKILDGKLYSRILDFCRINSEGVVLKIVKELSDLNNDNIFIRKDGSMIFLDEEVFEHNPKGLGIVKPLGARRDRNNPKISGWMKNSRQREAFWKGYTSKHSNDYFTESYQKLLYILRCLRSLNALILIKKTQESERKIANFIRRINLTMQ